MKLTLIRTIVSVALAAGICTVEVRVAYSEPISLALAAVSTAIGGLFTWSTVIKVGLLIGAQVGLSLLQKKASADTGKDKGVQINAQMGGDVPRSAIFGRFPTAGHFIYWNTFGSDADVPNKYLELVYAIGDGVHEGLQALVVDGKPCTIGVAGANGYIINEFTSQTTGGTAHTVDAGSPAATPKAWVRFYNGTDTQVADPGLVAHGSTLSPGRWTTDNVLTGVAYVVVVLEYDENVFTHIPQFLFQILGLRLYDVRKDSTQGGFGSHRWGNPATYEFSNNAAVGLLNYQLGVFAGGQLMLGEGVSLGDMVIETYIATANACDEFVPLKGGGTEPRYVVGMEVSAAQQATDVINDFILAMAGSYQESAGQFVIQAGVAQTVEYPTITDKDLISGYPIEYSAKRPRTDLLNTIFGTYVEPFQNWATISFPPRQNTADLALDGEILASDRQYNMITSVSQAQRVAEIDRRLTRFQASATITLDYSAIVLEPLDWVRWNSGFFGDKVWQILTVQENEEDHFVTLSLRQIATNVYLWNTTTDELDSQPTVDQPGLPVQLTTVAAFEVDATTVDSYNASGNPTGLKIPALRFHWSSTRDRTIKTVIIQYRVKNDVANVKESVSNSPASGSYTEKAGIQAGTRYEARATITTEPERPTQWTNWIEATSGSQHVVPTAQNVSPGGLTYQAFDQMLREIYTDLRRIIYEVDARSNRLAGVVGHLDVERFQQLADIRRTMISKHDEALGATAEITQDFLNFIGEDGAFAELNTSVTATWGSNYRGSWDIDAFYPTRDIVRFNTRTYEALVDNTGVQPNTHPETWKDVTFQAISGSVAQVTQDFTTFAGPLGAFGQMQDRVEAGFGDNAGSLASLEVTYSAFAGEGGVYVQDKTALKAALDGSSATFEEVTTLSSVIDGKLVSTHMMVFDNNGRVTGEYSYSDNTVGEIVWLFDHLLWAAPGVNGGNPVVMLDVENIDGTPRGVFNGNFYVKSLYALSINTPALFVDGVGVTNMLADNAAAHANSDSSIVDITSSGTTNVLLSQTFDVTQTPGKVFKIYASATGVFSVSGASGTVCFAWLRINGVNTSALVFWTGGENPKDYCLSASVSLTGTGSPQTTTVELIQQHQGGGTLHSIAVVGAASTRTAGYTLYSEATKR